MAPSEEASPDLLAVGVIRKAHGVRGEASVEIWTDVPDRLESLRQVTLVSPDESQRRAAEIETVRLHAGRALIKFGGIESLEEVRLHQGWTVEIPRSEARPLEEGEYFLHDLQGLKVFSAADGAELGVIERADDVPGAVLLTVRKPDGKRFEVPFAESICTTIDVAAGRMVVELPAGLDQLDAVKAIEDEPRLRIDVVTIFPRMFDALMTEGVVARGLKQGILELKVWDLRDFATDRHRSTDDEPYGGGAGMVMLPEPVFRCVEAIRSDRPGDRPRVLMLSPQGCRFDQQVASALAARPWLVLLCGRYEGFDERVRKALVDEEISVGDFVVSGGEVPAMLLIDAVSRMVEGVVGERNSVEADSFYNGLLDHPHYTRPAEFRGMAVPEVLLSGHAENIRKWRLEQALRATRAKRPDLLASAELDEEKREILDRLSSEGEQ
jgi:tRNA (guanine37-N1)-methyltransferase